jgi:hypothetical protein
MIVLGTCRHCGATDVPIVVYVRNETWCRPCRAAEIALRPALPETATRRPLEVVVTHDGRTYRFASRAEARRTMRSLLHCRRLPAEIVAQIDPIDVEAFLQ